METPAEVQDKKLESTNRDSLKRRCDYAALGITIVYFIVLFLFFQPISNGPDSNGYYIQARLLVDTGKPWFERESLMQYSSPHWLQHDNGIIASRYPPGMAVLLAVPYMIGGTYALPFMNLVFTSLSLLALYLICRKWIGPVWGLVAMLAMLMNPIANQWAFIGFAHPATAFFLMWGIYFLSRWESSFSPWVAFGIGVWFGVIPTLRYSEGLFIAAAGLFIFMHVRQSRRAVGSVVTFSIGALIPIILLLIYNYMLYGYIGGTGYDGLISIFSIQSFFQKFFPYLGNLFVRGVGLFFVFGILGVVFLCNKSETRKYGVLFASFLFPVLILYMAYFFPDPSMRFLLPTLYLYVIAGVWFFQMIYDWAPKLMKISLGLVILCNILITMLISGVNMFMMRANTENLIEATSVVAEYAKPGDIIITPQNLQIYFDFLGTWRVVDGSYLKKNPQSPFDALGELGADNKPLARSNVNEQDLPPQVLVRKALTEMERNHEAIERYKMLDENQFAPAFLNDLFVWSQPNRSIFWIEKWDEMVKFDSNNIHLEKLDELEVPSHVFGMPGLPPPRGPRRLGPPGQRGRIGKPENNPDLDDPDGVIPNTEAKPDGPRMRGPNGMRSLIEKTETMTIAKVELLLE
jgi:hypothetical protein